MLGPELLRSSRGAPTRGPGGAGRFEYSPFLSTRPGNTSPLPGRGATARVILQTEQRMASLRLTQRQWRIYLTVWLVALAAVTGTLVGVALPRLLAKPPPATLSGGLIINPHVHAPSFTLRDQRGAMVSPSDLRGRV